MIGFTCSTWDLMHPGHCIFLRDCKEYCVDNDIKLAVGLQTMITDRPEKNKPIQTVLERWIQLSAVLGPEHQIIPYESESDLLHLLAYLGTHTRFLGSDYSGKEFTGENIYDGFSNSDLVMIERDHMWSTSQLRKKIADSEYNKH